jgi:hypothetical protein
MFRKLVIFAILLSTTLLFGQSGWIVKGDFNLMINQSYYSDNWTGTEESAIDWVSRLNLSAEKPLSQLVYWNNIAELKWGQKHVYNKVTEKWFKPTESEDQIVLESSFDFKVSKYFDLYASVRDETYFTNFNNELFDPNLLIESVGLSKEFIKTEKRDLTSRLGWATREMMVRGKTTIVDSGIESVTVFNEVFMKDMAKFKSELRLYEALYNSEADELYKGNDDWKSLDMQWKNDLTIQLMKYVGLGFYFELDYDKQVDKKTYYKETLGLSVTYNLF